MTISKLKVENYVSSLGKSAFSNCSWTSHHFYDNSQNGWQCYVYEVRDVEFSLNCRVQQAFIKRRDRHMLALFT